MFEIVKAIHEALHIESTWAFVLILAIAGGVVSGAAAWIVDKGYRNALEERLTSLPPNAQPSPPSKTFPTPAVTKTTKPKSAPDITWDFNGFLGLVGGVGQEPWVISFQARGRNNLDEPISQVSGYVRSDVTNAQFPILLEVDGTRATNGIPRKSDFLVHSESFLPRTNPAREGIAAANFVADFATFTFVFEYEGKRFVRHFTNDEIWKDIEAFRRDSQVPKRRF